MTYIPDGSDKSTSVPASVDAFGDVYAVQLANAIKNFNKLSKSRKLTQEETYYYEQYSREFDNAMNQITNTQQAVYNYQPGK